MKPSLNSRDSPQNSIDRFPSVSQNIPRQSLKNQRSLSTSSFLNRNYHLPTQRMIKARQLNPELIKQDNLNILLYKWKSYYNEVKSITNEKEHRLDSLKKESKFLQWKHQQLIEFQNIELPEESISVKNFNELKLSRAEIEGQVQAKVQEKRDLDIKLKNEFEYSKTISFMHDQEKSNWINIHKQILSLEDKIATVRKSQKNWDAHRLENKKKKHNYSELLEKELEDINWIDNVVQMQATKADNMNKYLENREKKNNNIKERIETIQESHKKLLIELKRDVIEKINETDQMQRIKSEQETNYIKTILCLYLIQKFFINKEEFNKTELLKSKEYFDFTSTRFTITDDSDAWIYSTNSFTEFETRNSPRKMMNSTMPGFRQPAKGSGSNNVGSTSSSTNNMNKTNTCFKSCKSGAADNHSTTITIHDLFDQFNEITWTKDDLFGYYSKILNRISFYRNTLVHYNEKQIQFEHKKEKFSRQVKVIISKDYKNFEDLINNNSRFKEFLNKNAEIIASAKQLHQASKVDKINKMYTRSEPGASDSCSIRNWAEDVFNSAHHLILENQNFIEAILTTWRTLNTRNEKLKLLFDKVEKNNNVVTGHEEHSFDIYCKELLEYLDVNPESKSRLPEGFEKEEFLNKFYWDKNNTKPNTTFINQFKLKSDIQIENETFNYLSHREEVWETLSIIFKFIDDFSSGHAQISEQTTENNGIHNKKDMNWYHNLVGKPALVNRINSAPAWNDKEKNYFPQKVKVTISNDDYSDENLDENTSLSGNQTTQVERKWSNIRKNSLEKQIIKKLYEPSLSRTVYSRQLNERIKVIKTKTITNSKANHTLVRKRGELDEMSRKIWIYNNPTVNINHLSNSTYNDVINFVYLNQIQLGKSQNVKAIRKMMRKSSSVSVLKH